MTTSTGPFDWRQKAIDEIDQALTVYATRRDELNRDGQAEKRARVVDEALDRRLALAAEQRTGRPILTARSIKHPTEQVIGR